MEEGEVAFGAIKSADFTVQIKIPVGKLLSETMVLKTRFLVEISLEILRCS